MGLMEDMMVEMFTVIGFVATFALAAVGILTIVDRFTR